jgi:hypothetical protein
MLMVFCGVFHVLHFHLICYWFLVVYSCVSIAFDLLKSSYFSLITSFEFNVQEVLVIRKIHPCLPSFKAEFTASVPLTRIRDIAHRGDIPHNLKVI